MRSKFASHNPDLRINTIHMLFLIRREYLAWISGMRGRWRCGDEGDRKTIL